MPLQPGVITIGIDPEIHLGPLTIAWHGLTIVIGILIGGVAAKRWLDDRGMDTEPLYTLGMLLAVGGIVGGRIFYVIEHGGPLFGTRGFTFDGGVLLAAILLSSTSGGTGSASAIWMPWRSVFRLAWRSAGSAT